MNVVKYRRRNAEGGSPGYEPLREGEELDHLPEWTRT